MATYGNNGRDVSQLPQHQSQPSRPPMQGNPHQHQMPHMFGNYNAPPGNGYGNVNMPMQMHHQVPPQHHSMHQVPRGYNNMPQYNNNPPNPNPHAPYPPTNRPRDWEAPDQRNSFERDPKRPRTYQPNDNSYNQGFDRTPSGMPPTYSQSQPSLNHPQSTQMPTGQSMDGNQAPPPNHPYSQGQGPLYNQQGPPPSGNRVPPMHQQQHDSYQHQSRQQAYQAQPPPPNQGMPYDASAMGGRKPPGNSPGQRSTMMQPGRNAPPPGAVGMNPGGAPEMSATPGMQNTPDPANGSKPSKPDADGPISFKDFLLRQPDTISPVDAKEKYDLYVRGFNKRVPNRFFDAHKDEEWFKERYDPDYVKLRYIRIYDEVNARAGDFKELWDISGSRICAPDISTACLDRTRGKSRNKAEKAPKGTTKREETTTKKTEEDSHGDVKPSEALEDAKVEESKHAPPNSETKEESIVKAEDMNTDEKIGATTKMGGTQHDKKPDSSMKAEDAADGPPSEGKPEQEIMDDSTKTAEAGAATKKEAKIENDLSIGEDAKVEADESGSGLADGEVKDEDVKEDRNGVNESKDSKSEHDSDSVMKDDEISNTQDNEMKVNVKDSSEVKDQDSKMDDKVSGESQRRSKVILELPLRRDHQKDTIFMRGIPINLKRADLTAVLAKGKDGDKDLKLRRLKIGDINPLRSLERFAWAVYANEEAATIAINFVRGVLVKSKKSKSKDINERGDRSDRREENGKDFTYEIDCMLNLQRKKKYTQGRVLPSAFGQPDRMAFDYKQATNMMRYMDKQRFMKEGVNPLSDEFLESLPSDGIRLDHVVTYLREVHYFCYYSGNEFLEDATSMPPQELRPCGERLLKSMSEADHRIVKRVDERAAWVLERDYDRPRSNSDSADVAMDRAVLQWLEANTKNEGQGRYRCGLPPHKLFKGPEFVHKHLRTKHGDKMEIMRRKAYIDVYRANFENDPSKDEVISIYDEGVASSQQRNKSPASRPKDTPPQYGGFTQGRGGGGMGMYNHAGPFMGMGMGMQPFPMMMMPGAGYSGYAGYPNMTFGRGMGGQGMGMMGMGMNGGDMMHGRPRREDPRDYNRGGHRGRGRRGSYRGRGDSFRRGYHDRPLDPRASGPRRSYNDLDAPANGPSFDLVKYDDI